jgi:ATP-binding cassette subfamily B multidrug efflux pump
VRGKIAAMAALTAVMSIFEAALFAILGRIVDWLGGQVPSRLWAERGDTLLWMLPRQHRVVALQTIVKHQTLAINFPLRLRWNFHRLMLGQSMAFYRRVRRPHHGQGDADRAGGARDGVHHWPT